ncbi:MAG: putative inner membrane protein regulated by LexA [Sodalis sp. Psp]|nr:putative inner membrane protein regulated by LexA [Sodalis sp. Psp]MCR3756733.1 putative inner membrane protein regulated by LexA [Sodalis sp. Ppy]
MTAEGHFLFALANTILAKKMALSPTLGQGDWWHVISGGLLTCLLPDIDHPQSLLGQRLKWLSSPIFRIFGHRGFTHSLLAIITGILLFMCLPMQITIPLDACHAMIIGYLSHIIADMLTPAGVPLLWPWRWRFRMPILSSTKGNQSERLVCIAVLLLALQHPVGIQIIRHLPVPDFIQTLWQRVHFGHFRR